MTIRRRLLLTPLLFTLALPVSGAETLPDDADLEVRIGAAFANHEDYADAFVRVESHRGFVLLIGQVPRTELKSQATNTVVFASSAIRRIVNELEVVGTVDRSTAGTDATLEAQVNAALQGLEPPPAAAVEAVVHNGVVYLLGAVEAAEAERLATHASTLEGVAGVRTVFEIVSRD